MKNLIKRFFAFYEMQSNDAKIFLFVFLQILFTLLLITLTRTYYAII